VSIAGLTVPKQTVGVITKQTPTLFKGTDLDGIIGMGFRAMSQLNGPTFVDGLFRGGQISQPIFGLYLTPKSVGNAQLTLGGTDPSKYTGNINFLPVDARKPYWNVPFQSITVNGRPSKVQPQVAVADSGTAGMIAPVGDAKAIYSLISPNIVVLDPRGAYGIKCTELAGLNATITFMMGGKPYTIPSKELSVGPYPDQPGKTGMCQTLINSDRSLNFWIIGESLLKYYYTVWDMGNRQNGVAPRLGFATTAHSPA